MAIVRTWVVVATFQGERHVADQLRSILEQDPPPSGVLVTDDGSTDATLEIVRDLASQSAVHVEVDDHDHLGLAGSLERALRSAAPRADLILLADQDDVWRLGKLARMASAVENHDALVAFHDGGVIDEQGSTLDGSLWSGAGLSRRRQETLLSGDPWPMLLRANPATGAAMALRPELLELALPLPPLVLHDAWFTLLAGALDRLLAVPDHLVSYRVHGHNVAGLVPERRSDRLRQRLARTGGRAADEVLFGEAAVRLAGLVSDSVLADLRAKAAFSRARTQLPANPLRRAVVVARHVTSGSYGRLADRAARSAAFDLLLGERATGASDVRPRAT